MNLPKLSPEVFQLLSQAMHPEPSEDDSTNPSKESSIDPIKGLMKQTLELMAEAEFEAQIGAHKSERTETRTNYRCGYRIRRFDTTCGSFNLKLPHPRKGGFVPSFMSKYSRYEKTLKKTIASAYVNGISTGKMQTLVESMGVEGISKGQVSKITDEVNGIAKAFRTRSLKDSNYPIVFIDAVFEKIRIEGHAKFMAIMIATGLNEAGTKDVIAIECLPDESKESYLKLFESLKTRGLKAPRLIISDGAAGLTSAMVEALPETKWQHCRVHLVRKIVKYVKSEDKKAMSRDLMAIWYTRSKQVARDNAKKFCSKYSKKYPKAVAQLRCCLEDTLTYLDFPEFKSRVIATSNIVERLNSEFRRRTRPIGVFPTIESCLKLYTLYCMNFVERSKCHYAQPLEHYHK